MLESLLITVNDMMLESQWTALAGSLIWGIIAALLSPCSLASIPLLISYVAGQDAMTDAARGAAYACFFSLGLFVAVFFIGAICSIAGKMLGDVPWWAYTGAGLILINMGIRRVRSTSCSCGGMSFGKLFKWKLAGYAGACILGFIYGMLSGICTFGFLAPMLAVITEEGQIAKGLLMVLAFALGHCLPIVAAGCGYGTAEMRKMSCVSWARNVSGFVILAIGLWFMAKPWL